MISLKFKNKNFEGNSIILLNYYSQYFKIRKSNINLVENKIQQSFLG